MSAARPVSIHRFVIAGIFAFGFFVSAANAASRGWVEVTSPNFVVVSDSGEKDARKIALHFEQIRALFRQTIPITQGHHGPVITIIAAEDQSTMQSLLPDYWTKGHAHPAGMFADAMNQFYILVQADAPGTNPYETVYHEYYHSLTTPYLPEMPAWIAEGLADFFGNTEIAGKRATVGEPSSDLLYQLSTTPLIPLDTLFRVDRSSPYYNEQSKATIFYAESWALVHYLMIGDNRSHRPILEAYLSALASGAKGDEALKAFGNLRKLQADLDEYVARRRYQDFILPVPPGAADSELKARPISEADADAYAGGFETVRGRSDQAKTLLDRALQLEPKNALAYQNLAITQFFLGEKSEALVSAERAIEFDPESKLTRYIRAYLTYNEAPGEEQSQIESDLRASIGGDPEFAPPYGLLAVYLASQNRNLDEAAGLARRAIALEPGEAEYQMALAQVLMRARDFVGARTALSRAKENAATPEQLLRTQMYLTSLDDTEKFAQERAAIAGADGGGPTESGELHRRSAATIGEDPNALEARGTVADVSCTNGLKIQLSTAEGMMMLHNVPGVNVQIKSLVEIPGRFTPCGLKGQRINVMYSPDKGTPQSGAIEVIELVGADSQN